MDDCPCVMLVGSRLARWLHLLNGSDAVVKSAEVDLCVLMRIVLWLLSVQSHKRGVSFQFPQPNLGRAFALIPTKLNRQYQCVPLSQKLLPHVPQTVFQ